VRPEADVVDVRVGAAVLDQQIGDAVDGEWTYLTDVGGIIERTGSNNLVELKWFVDELERGNQHAIKGSRFAARRK
jgi:hypothetical protein